MSQDLTLRSVRLDMVLTRQGRQVSCSVMPLLPMFIRAPVVQGMRRGGKELGIPTGMTYYQQ